MHAGIHGANLVLMKKQTRERIALLFLIVLVALVAAVLVSYFSTGRSWTVAASVIDDAAGRMDGYTALVYTGTTDSHKTSGGEAASDGANGADGVGLAVRDGSDPSLPGDVLSGEILEEVDSAVSDPDGAVYDADGEAVAPSSFSDDANDISKDASDGAAGDLPEAVSDVESDADPEAADAASTIDTASDSADEVDSTIDVSSEGEDESASSNSDNIGLRILSLLSRSNAGEDAGVYMSDVRDLYERKGADVLSLDANDLDSYLDPQILYAGNKCIGVYSLDYYATSSRLSRFMDYFKEQDVDVVVCLAKRANLLATYEGTDVVIVTGEDEDVSTSGHTYDGTFIVQAPARGEVGVVVLSTNEVPSAKVVSAL